MAKESKRKMSKPKAKRKVSKPKAKRKEAKIEVSLRIKLPIKGELEDIKKKFQAILLEKVDTCRHPDEISFSQEEQQPDYEIEY